MILRLASRRSPLALIQTREVAGRLHELDPTLEIEIVALSTRGDEMNDRSLAPIGGKGLFISALEEALRDGRADAAVHSLKDVPMELDRGFGIVAVLPRADPRDYLVGTGGLDELPAGSSVGTSSLRRQSQILARRPDLRVVPARGSVSSRLDLIACGTCEALVLAWAGLQRLGLKPAGQPLDPEAHVPAIGQGAIAVECWIAANRYGELLGALHDPACARSTAAERAFGHELAVDCTAPIGAWAGCHGDGTIRLVAFAGSADGRRTYRESLTGHDPKLLGSQLAQRFHEQGIRNYFATTP
jgi:hydroxymethylbilane synthase